MGDSGSIRTSQCRVHFRVHGLAVEQARLKPVAGSEIVNDSIEEDARPKWQHPSMLTGWKITISTSNWSKRGSHCGLSKYHDDNQMSEREHIKFYIFVWEPLKRYKDRQRSSDDVMTEREYLEYLQRVKESEGYDCGMCQGYFDGMILEKTRLMFEEIENANLQVAGIARYFVTSTVRDIDGSQWCRVSRYCYSCRRCLLGDMCVIQACMVAFLFLRGLHKNSFENQVGEVLVLG
ncbi:hypothetical protein OROMI_011238 [Orobanche minor]